MKIRFFIGQLCSLILVITQITSAQQKTEKVIILQKQDDAWWTGVINQGELMPVKNGYTADLSSNYGNQVQPLLLSDKGEVIWSDDPCVIRMNHDTLSVISEKASIQYSHPGQNLREAFLVCIEDILPSLRQDAR